MRMELLLENKDLAIPAGLTGSATFTLSPVEGKNQAPKSFADPAFKDSGTARSKTPVPERNQKNDFGQTMPPLARRV